MTAKTHDGVKQTTVRIPAALAKKLRMAAAYTDKSQQDIINDALRSELNKKEYAAGAKQ